MPATCGKRPAAPSTDWVAILVYLDAAHAVFQRCQHVCAAQLKGADQIAEGQHSQYFTQGDLAGINIGADAAAILDDDV